MKLSESEYGMLAEEAPVLIWVSDVFQNCLYVNRRWCEFTGQTFEEALGQGWRATLNPEDTAESAPIIQQGFETQSSFEVEFRMLRSDGQYRWMLNNANPRFDADGNFVGFTGTSIEIHSERLLREQAISQQKRLTEFYQKTPVMMHSVDKNEVIVSVSDAWLSHFGYERQEVIGRQRTDFMSEPSRKLARRRFKAFLELGHCDKLNYQFVTKSGDVRDVKLSAITEADVDGNYLRSIAVLEDVTDSRRSLRRLQQTQQVFDQSGEAIFWLTLAGKVTYVNQQACLMLEYSSSELLEMSVWDFDVEFSREVWERGDWREDLYEQKCVQSMYKSRSGRRIPVEISAKLIIVDEEPIICGFVRDLTDSIRNENELALAQRRLEEALRSGNVGLWDWDMTTNDVFFSAEWKTQIGLNPKAELKGYEDWESRVHPEDLQAAVSRLEDYLSGRSKDYVSVFRFRHEDGSYRWIHAQGSVFHGKDGSPERMIGVHVDVTDHQNALNELAQRSDELAVRSAELEAIFYASPEIFFRTDKSGLIKDYRVSLEAPLLMPPEEFLGKRMHDLVPDRVARIYNRAYKELARSGESQTLEYRIRIEGKNLWHQAVFVPFRGDSVAIFIRDVTDRKTSELELRARTTDLERSNADLDQFAYVASHDLKTPLRGIQHLTKWIREDSEGKLPAECELHLDRLDEQVLRMQSLLDDLLQFSRAGRVRVAVEPIDLREMVDEIIGLVNPPSGMTIKLDAGRVQISTGRAPLFHVLLNLVENAVKYHDRPDGIVQIRVTETSDMEYVQFEVSDNGPGIEKEHHERIFRMFQRLDSTKAGTGMGLAVVRKMIESRGGTIQMSSVQGEETRFWFTWPSSRDLPEVASDDDES